MFLYTPRGHNHGYDLYNMARMNPDWYCQTLTIKDTKAITLDEVEKDRKEGMDDDLIEQEYFCSFEGAMQGSYYGKQIQAAIEEGRITKVPYDISLKVHTAWDLGVGDLTSIWFFQTVGMEIRFIDYYETSGEGLAHYIKVLQDKKYIYGRHFAPHDIKVRELTTGKSRLEAARLLGINFVIAPNLPLEEGIDAVRRTFNKCWFDEEKTKPGLNALMNYHKEYDEKRKEFKPRPHHDWSSHASDSFRMMAVGLRQSQIGAYDNEEEEIKELKRQQNLLGEYNPLNPFDTF